MRCNHCNTELALVKEPLPFNYCVMAGFLSGVIPAQYCLYILKTGFIKGMLCGALSGLMCLAVISILVFKNIRYKLYV